MEEVAFHMQAVENQVRVVDKNIMHSRVTAMRMMEPYDLLQVQLLEQGMWHTYGGP